MLKTNSKKAIDNIKNYVVDNFTPDDYGIEPSEDFKTVAGHIYHIFVECMHNNFEWGKVAESAIFADWCAGLPSIFDTCYYYNRSAVDDLGEILEETEEEKEKYTQTEAEKLLTALIYREIKKAVKK